jgi:hypothetical protein
VEDVEPFDPDEPSWEALGDDRYLKAPVFGDDEDGDDSSETKP